MGLVDEDSILRFRLPEVEVERVRVGVELPLSRRFDGGRDPGVESCLDLECRKAGAVRGRDDLGNPVGSPFMVWCQPMEGGPRCAISLLPYYVGLN